MMTRRYNVLRDFIPTTRGLAQGDCRAGKVVALTARQARFLLLSGHLALAPDPAPATETPAEPEPAAEAADDKTARRRR